MKKIFSIFLSLCVAFQLMCVVDSGVNTALADDITDEFTLSYLSEGEWNEFTGTLIAPSNIDGFRITSTASDYYFKYRTKNSGINDYYPYVTSIEDDYAGVSGRAIQRLQILACNSDGSLLETGLVAIYRVHKKDDGAWLSWLSTAQSSWANKVLNTYGFRGSLDTSGDDFAGSDVDIDGIEFRVFRETNDQNETKPEGLKKVIDAPYINQLRDYPTGCESVSATMALQYAGIDVSVDTFIDDYLEKGPTSDFHPDEVFGGDPRTNWSYGCYAPVIKRAVDKIITDYEADVHATELHGVSLEELKTRYLDNDIPVIFWGTMGMNCTYRYTTKTSSSSDYRWIANEHCLLLTGYDDYNYYFNDPLEENSSNYKKTKYSKYAVDNAYTGLLKQAIVIEPNEVVLPELYGDVDSDNNIDSVDALLVLSASVNKIIITKEQRAAADVDNDKDVTSYDALMILQKVVHMLNAFPAEDNYLK